MRKHPTKNRANLKRALIEKLAHVVNEEDLIALNNVIDKFIPPKKQSLLPEEVFGKNWTDQNIRLGKIIQGLRFREGLTQVELAKILKGVKQANISSWERGKEKIPSKRLNQLAKIFGTNIKKLLEDNT
jgi:DNA-binding transcriptional regulator YiaG